MDNLEFSYNWNNKLDCKAFTTIRLYNPAKHFVNQRYAITLKGQPHSTGTVVGVKPFLLRQLNEFMSYVDTGYSAAECTGIIEKMYGNRVDLNVKQLVLLLIKKDK